MDFPVVQSFVQETSPSKKFSGMEEIMLKVMNEQDNL